MIAKLTRLESSVSPEILCTYAGTGFHSKEAEFEGFRSLATTILVWSKSVL